MSLLHKQLGIFIATASLAATPAFAADNGLVDSASLEYGTGAKVRTVRAAVQSDWDARWLVSHGRHLSGYWDLSASWLRGSAYRNVQGQRQNIAVIGFTPVFRYERADKRGWYAEAGIGANLFSELYNNYDNQLSTAFQFGDHIGIGYVTQNKWELGLKLLHYSNASIKRPNSGVNLVIASARYHF